MKRLRPAKGRPTVMVSGERQSGLSSFPAKTASFIWKRKVAIEGGSGDGQEGVVGSSRDYAMQTVDVSWLIGGDFNAVRDLSEVCGASGDIRMAMEEFNGCVQNAGLLPLPMQGEWYTWHNYSANQLYIDCGVSLGLSREKPTDNHNVVLLDRMLINDRWMAQFPTSFYTSLNPRTSDHSPLVLNGDSQQQYGGVPMYAVTRKLKALRPVFREQRRNKGVYHTMSSWLKGFLRWRNCLQLLSEDGSFLLEPFTPADVKQAVFDIVEDKAPGLDGYSSGFFKTAWPIVGQEVSSEVLDFFSTSRLLKQINTTLLALIPKARLPPRCALKVDIRKAYDTVEWDFMIAMMELFGFPSTFSKWIEACVTTPSFSIVLNGKPHGFFKGAKGLRQGDPLSPYLFVLVMEVLHLGFLQLIDQNEVFSFRWKCDTARVLQLGFVDDLLLLCRADMDSIRVFKTGLDRFADWSGLRLNLQKSHLIISRSTQGLREEMLAELGFQEGVLSMRYLGLPLLSSRLTTADCRLLLSKIDKRIAGWEGMAISYAGRVQIIKSVLMSLSLYWASAFILPKKVTNKIEKRLRAFLWKGTTTSGYAKVAWKDLCRPKEEGGLGFKDISILNRALLTKKLCDIIRCDRTSIWVEWLYQGQLQDTSIWTIREHGGSWGWRKILRLRVFLRPMVDYQIGDGRRFYLWLDPWHYLGPLSNTFPRGPRLLGLEESAKLSMVISGGEWQWPPITVFKCLEITHTLPTIHGGEDRIVWRFEHGLPTVQALYRLFDLPGPKVCWSSLLSGSFKIPRHLFIL
ncbi:UNVERIFIED_CONTAM: hypothetical protein Sindi_2317200 [Sesamum indicum]